MQSVSFSQKGSKSDSNEDACLSLPSKGLFVVADGVGGGPSGDIASRAVVDTLCAALDEVPLTEELILHSIELANQHVFEVASSTNRGGMASTVTVGWRQSNKLHCFNVGDSRIYLVRDGSIRQLTRDHIRQVQKAPNVVKQVVTNAVGIKPRINVEVTRHELVAGDILALMSDGISDQLDDDAILSVLVSDQYSLMGKARALVEESERRGGRDDKSVILTIVD